MDGFVRQDYAAQYARSNISRRVLSTAASESETPPPVAEEILELFGCEMLRWSAEIHAGDNSRMYPVKTVRKQQSDVFKLPGGQP